MSCRRSRGSSRFLLLPSTSRTKNQNFMDLYSHLQNHRRRNIDNTVIQPFVCLPHVPVPSQKTSRDIFLPLSSPPSRPRPALPLDPLSLSLPSFAPVSASWRASPNPSARTMITGWRVAVVMFISLIPVSTDVILSLGRQRIPVTRTVSNRMRP